jgi:hypothetical protein
MKRIGMVVVLVLVATMTFAPFAQARGTEFNQTEPFTFSFTHPCTGEQITGDGTSHIMGTFMEDPRGGLHWQSQTNTSGRGVGSPSGAMYIVNGASHDAIYVRDNEYPVTLTLFQRTQFIRQGEDMPEDDFVFYTLYHITINANGELTTEVGEIDPESGGIVSHEECR